MLTKLSLNWNLRFHRNQWFFILVFKYFWKNHSLIWYFIHDCFWRLLLYDHSWNVLLVIWLCYIPVRNLSGLVICIKEIHTKVIIIDFYIFMHVFMYISIFYEISFNNHVFGQNYWIMVICCLEYISFVLPAMIISFLSYQKFNFSLTLQYILIILTVFLQKWT